MALRPGPERLPWSRAGFAAVSVVKRRAGPSLRSATKKPLRAERAASAPIRISGHIAEDEEDVRLLEATAPRCLIMTSVLRPTGKPEKPAKKGLPGIICTRQARLPR